VILGLIFNRGLSIALHAADTYRRNLAAGISIYLVIQSVFIIGGNIRLLPLSGVTLPFVSYGGSSMLTGILGVWILLVISSQSGHQPVSNLRVEPYLISGALILAALAGAALVSGWWAVIRSADLVERVDNPRRSIAERYVQRGSLVDRSGNPISRSVGVSGDFKREYFVSRLAATTGIPTGIWPEWLEKSYDAYCAEHGQSIHVNLD
jgi:hypothetical protein